MNARFFYLAAICTLGFLMTVGCDSASHSPDRLDKLDTIHMTIKGTPFELWIADDTIETATGLMNVPAERMAPKPDGTQRGMIFVFHFSAERSFWMKDTIIPLDIAYVSTDGAVVSTYTMAPLDSRPNQYPSGKPFRFAIEVNAGVWAQIGLHPDDRIQIPDSLLKR